MIDSHNYWEKAFKNLENYDFRRIKIRSDGFLMDFYKSYLEPGVPVLDTGCGTGRNAVYLAEKGYRVYGTDISSTALSFCKKCFLHFNFSGNFVQASFERLPFCNSFFSALICVAALDHVTLEVAGKAIAEMRRVLRPDGKMFLTFDSPDTDEDIIHEADILPDGTLKFITGKQKGMLFRRYKDEEIKKLLGKENIIFFDYYRDGSRVIIFH